MAVTAYIARVRAAAADPSDVDLGMQVPMGDEKTSGALQQEEALTFLKSIYQPLKRHYHWFRRTQRGQIKQYGRQARSRTEAYRWRGRSATHVLTSGMDDYPRGPPHAGELHLDLMSWMAFFTGTMRDIAGFIGETDDELSYLEIEKSILDNLEGENMLCSLSTGLTSFKIYTGVRNSRCTVTQVSMTKVRVAPTW